MERVRHEHNTRQPLRQALTRLTHTETDPIKWNILLQSTTAGNKEQNDKTITNVSMTF